MMIHVHVQGFLCYSEMFMAEIKYLWDKFVFLY